jgi:hypothetical protein
MRKTIVLLLIFVCLVSTACSANKKFVTFNSDDKNNRYIDENTKISDRPMTADYHIPTDFDNLKERTALIVTVKSLQDLGQDYVDNILLGSRKEVEIIKVHGNKLKKDLKKGDIINIVEPAYVENGEYHTVEDYIKMDDDKEYTLFLVEGDDENEYGVVSLSYGKYSKTEKTKKGKVTDFKFYKELEPYDFISELDIDVKQYEKLKSEVINQFK